MKKISDSELIKKLHNAVIIAKNNIETAENWLNVLLDKNDLDLSELNKKFAKKSKVTFSEEENIVYGAFDGEKMIDDDKKDYPVPSNYASKSKLVSGDKLKLTIKTDGSFIFKQIELIPRKLITGKLILDESQYKVITESDTYKVLYASVTFFRCNVGDNVTIIVPEGEVCDWAAIENVIPE